MNRSLSASALSYSENFTKRPGPAPSSHPARTQRSAILSEPTAGIPCVPETDGYPCGPAIPRARCHAEGREDTCRATGKRARTPAWLAGRGKSGHGTEREEKRAARFISYHADANGFGREGGRQAATDGLDGSLTARRQPSRRCEYPWPRLCGRG